MVGDREVNGSTRDEAIGDVPFLVLALLGFTLPWLTTHLLFGNPIRLLETVFGTGVAFVIFSISLGLMFGLPKVMVRLLQD